MDIKDKLTKAFYKSEFWCKKSAPDICIACGVVGITVATVMACKATTKAKDILEDREKSINDMDECLAATLDYDDDDYKNDKKITNVHTAMSFAKLYAPSVGLWLVSLGCIIESHHILKKRNVALAAAYSTMDSTFRFYRKNVVDRFGDKVDKEMRYGIKEQEIEETKVGKDGKEKVVKKKETISDLNTSNDYSKFFDSASREWKPDQEYNLFFLKTAQSHFNDILKIKGYVFLNDIYKWLDLPETLAGQCAGWVYDKSNPDADNYIDFGIFGPDGKINNANVRFVNGYEDVILLDFNVDGNILDKFYKFSRY